MMKYFCGMIAIKVNGEDYLVVIGGEGPSSVNTPTQPGAQYNQDLFHSQERCNEVHMYRLKTGEWTSPTVTGDRPPPIDQFTLTSITNTTAILFGGSFGGNTGYGDTKNNDVYVFEFTDTSVKCTKYYPIRRLRTTPTSGGWIIPHQLPLVVKYKQNGMERTVSSTGDLVVKSVLDINEYQKRRIQDAVGKWMEEGSVDLTVTRVNMLGAPGAGKTCSQLLLLNEDPPTNDTSTPIACPAVRAIRVAVCDKTIWNRVTRDKLLDQLAADLESASLENKTKEPPLPVVFTLLDNTQPPTEIRPDPSPTPQKKRKLSKKTKSIIPKQSSRKF
uniref:Uncharacterized protein n=1 Tax=Amphimedon queenslandica TaxID=400682 RepID=A0A1X7T2N7_AMPQE